MKRVLMFTATLGLFTAILLSFSKADDRSAIDIGADAPLTEVVMEDAISGKDYTLDGIKKENGLLVMFSCNTCPWVLAWEDRYDDIAAACADNKIGFIVVNANEAQRGSSDSKAGMKAHAEDKNYTFPYVIDKNHVLADAFGATKTPDLFLFDGTLKLQYKGAIDDNGRDPSAVTKKYIENAITNMVAGKAIDPNSTRSIGCSIKRL